MTTSRIFGLVLIALGVIALAYQGITYTTQKKIVDIGPIEVTQEKTNNIPLPPIVGGIAVIGGIAMLVLGRAK